MTERWLEQGTIGRVRRILAGRSCLLVGGAVRDHRLGRPPHDLDLVVDGDGEATARLLEDELEARRIRLGGDRFAAWRLVTDDGAIDLWDREGETVESDLRRRDLTINAIAVELDSGRTIDPLGGGRDLERGVLRACSERSFAEDALRVLRLARFAAEFPEFRVEPATARLAAAERCRLAAVASERRRDELSRTLQAPAPARALGVWATTGVFEELTGNAGGAAEGVEKGWRLALRAADKLPLPPAPPVDVEALLATLLIELPYLDRASAPAEAVEASESRLEELLADGWMTRSGARKTALLLDLGPLPARTGERRWWLHRAGELWPTALCREGAKRDDGGWQSLRETAAVARSDADAIFRPETLLRGDAVAELLGLAPGPELGVLVRRLRRRQIEGSVTTDAEARAWLLSERRSSGAD